MCISFVSLSFDFCKLKNSVQKSNDKGRSTKVNGFPAGTAGRLIAKKNAYAEQGNGYNCDRNYYGQICQCCQLAEHAVVEREDSGCKVARVVDIVLTLSAVGRKIFVFGMYMQRRHGKHGTEYNK